MNDRRRPTPAFRPLLQLQGTRPQAQQNLAPGSCNAMASMAAQRMHLLSLTEIGGTETELAS